MHPRDRSSQGTVALYQSGALSTIKLLLIWTAAMCQLATMSVTMLPARRLTQKTRHAGVLTLVIPSLCVALKREELL